MLLTNKLVWKIWVFSQMTHSGAAFLQSLIEETDRLANALESARVTCEASGRPDIIEWIARELAGYDDGDTIFSCRKLPTVEKALITNGVETECNHVIGKSHQWIKAAVRDISTLPELQDALQQERDFLIYDVNPDQYFYRRMLSATKPGYAAQRIWMEAPLGGLSDIVAGISDRLAQLLADLHRKPSWDQS